ncbi:SDR family oxidoreductase [Sphingomonas sp. ASV193]|uniref:SDR family NAD(P)-dependent oxidoreductase n=1 Tax=Sphingomonas sp. ASV193 TaxID=3144405 RepID=UPI0032E90285
MKTYLVTGAASGIGAACAARLAAAGHRLVLVDRAAIGGPHAAHRGDVADPAFWQALPLPALDGAVLCAGVSGAGTIAAFGFDDWRRVLSVNLDGMFLSLKAALGAVRDGGSIVALASVSGIKAEAGTAAYGASKAGVIQLVKVAAKEAAARGVRVNALAPGGVDTPMWDSMPFFAGLVEEAGGRDAAIAAMAGATPLGRYASADEIAAQAEFLLGEAAATITGAVLVGDGGYSL